MGKQETFDFADQVKIFDRDKCPRVHILGAGGATNGPIICLGTMGVREIDIYDPDILKKHNGAGEPMYSFSNIGKPKVDAAIDTFKFLRPTDESVRITPHYEFIDETYCFDGIVISGFDSMVSRKKAWAAIKNSPMVSLYIDFRSSGTSLTVLTVDPLEDEEVEAYERDWLYSDEEALEDVCGARNIPFIAMTAGGLAGAIVASFVNGSLRDMFEVEKTIYFTKQDPFVKLGDN